MAQAIFRHGKPTMVDYTAGGNIAAGDVIVTNDTPRIAHHDIANGDLGALAAGGGVYEVVGDAAIAADTAVYWDDSTNKVTEDDGGNKFFGFTVTACADDDETCLVRHDPQVIGEPSE